MSFPQAPGGFAAGSRVGGYLLEEQIGLGGMAVVFRALDEKLGRRVALKILAPALADDPGFRQRFVRESRAAAAVDDPHIIPLYEAGEADGLLFIAMRYVQGGDVCSLLAREGALDADRVAAIVSPVASALDAAHAAGLVHRDVKPANMLLDVRPGRPDHVYLSDFGLSKEAAAATGLTGTGLFVGTADYAAPEQIDGRAVDGGTDQYALACAAFEMLCGQPPFRRDHGLAVLHAHLSTPPPMLSAMRAGLPAAADAVFARALAKSPQDRYPSCGEFSEALCSALGLAPAASGQRTARWPFILMGSVVVAAGIAVAVVLAARIGSSPPGKAANSTPPAVRHSTTPPSGPGWTTYQDPSGFSVQLPPGWAEDSATRTGSYPGVDFTGPVPGFHLFISWSVKTGTQALPPWQTQAASFAKKDPTYYLIRLTQVTYRGYNSAVWEFTDVHDNVLTHVIDLGFIVRPRVQAYAIELYGPQADWSSVYRGTWSKVLATFEPAP